MTAIEWTQRPGTKGETWNPVVGCSRASGGCDNCYAVTMTHRLEAMGQAKYAGLTVLNPRGDRHFNGVVRTVPEALPIPLGWKKPRTVFVNSMSDLFHPKVPFDFIDQVFAVMALCPQHTFLILTKRPERMAEYLAGDGVCYRIFQAQIDASTEYDLNTTRPGCRYPLEFKKPMQCEWPLPNVWLGASAERQNELDERLPHLIRCPAAVRFLSCEPLLGELDIFGPIRDLVRRDLEPNPGGDGRYLHWVIAGGESGPGAAIRGCDVAHIRSIVRQCREAQVPVFVKQLGSRPVMNYYAAAGWYEERGWDILDHRIVDGVDGREWVPSRDGQPRWDAMLEIQNRRDDRKGGDPAEWPEDLRVREWPAVVMAEGVKR